MKLHRLAVPALALVLAVPGFAAAASPGGVPPAGYGQWDAPPQEFRDIQRQGFHDGIEGARKDFENHRQPNVNNRDEYRHPNVPPPARHDYREAFRRGYQTGVAHLSGGPR